MLYQVKQVADMSGVSVRTLHHYDHIGLLTPKEVSKAGYRLYSDACLERLQHILFFKEIGFRLEDIKNMLDHPAFQRKAALESQKDILLKKRERIDRMIETADKTIASIEGGAEMKKRELFAGLSMKEIEEHQMKYADEARALYGKAMTDETEKKTAAYTQKDWSAIMSEWGAIYERIAKRMEKGPDDAEVQEAVGDFRNHISTFFYDCTPDIFRGLGDLYTADQRFTENIDRYGKGLSAFLRQAIIVYCENENSRA
ncbi:MerR family transcriptional regulator [Bacillus sp. YC2]|uniref:MerR family transcriptional regulator n=1 Tax=Bacillus sp. YC2 TaxID=2861287 RepID=UPI001CA68E97|nr:MerR family transcriptional regulator [Bacillus sp. YC2]MBY8911688.1 MerR family transcriptional regulator [Bacillus sp. YC2]